MSKEQAYCVAAEDRQTKKRIAITGPLSKGDAQGQKIHMNMTGQSKKAYRYFHVAKWPYKPKQR